MLREKRKRTNEAGDGDQRPSPPSTSSAQREGKAASVSSAPKPARKKVSLAFKLFLPLFGILVLVLIEVVLRVAGFGSRTRLFVRTKGADGTPVYRLNPQAAERFFFRRFEGRPVAPSRVLPVEFPVHKPPETIRIITMGDSTAAGFPYPRSAAFSGFLRAMLSDLHPSKKFEVINCAMTALNSFAVLDFMPEVLRAKPDLIVIYCTHNEFYGCHGVGSLEAITTNRTLIRLFMAVQKTCLYQGVKALAKGLRRPSDAKAATTLIEVMARDQEIRRYSRKHAIAESSFRRNLEATLKCAQKAGIPVVVTTVVSNVRDLSPLRSAHRADLGANDLQRWEALWSEAVQKQQSGDFERAATLYRQALEIDPEYAECHFRLAQCRAHAGQWEQARPEFLAALEYDALHFRACPVFNEIVRETVARSRTDQSPAILADVVPVFDKETSGGIVGYELMTDHLHPNTRGNYLIARTICQTLAESAMRARFGPSWDFARLRRLEQYEREVGYSPIERYLTSQILVSLYDGFPFETQINREQKLAQLNDETSRCVAALSFEERRQLLQWSGRIHTFALHLQLGDTYWERGNYAQAAESYREATRQVGQGSPEDYQHAWVGLAKASRKMGAFDEAIRAYEEALKFPGQHAAISYNIGRLHMDRRDFVRAEQALARVLEERPDDSDALINLGLIARDQNQAGRARQYFERAAATETGRVLGNYHLGWLSFMQGNLDKASEYLRQALAADARHVQSLRVLGFCHLQRGEYDQAETAFSRAVEIDASDAATWYNRACAAAAQSKTDLALESVKQAISLGGAEMSKRAAAEPLFGSLRADPRFQALLR